MLAALTLVFGGRRLPALDATIRMLLYAPLRVMRIRFARVALLSLILSLSACARANAPARGEHRRLVPALRIGSETAGDAYRFTMIRQVVASDSEVFVLPADLPEIRVFGDDGRHRRTIGRRGAGPGEFDAVTAIGLVGDTLWTLDANLRRVTRFRADGELLTMARLETMSPDVGRPGRSYFFYPMAVLPDGALLGFGGTTGRAIAAGEVTALPLLRVPTSARAADTLGWVPVGNEHLILRSIGGTMYRAQPFSDGPLTAYAPSTEQVLVVERYAARDEGRASARVTALGMQGDTMWSTTLPYRPRRLEPRAVDSVRAHLTRELASRYSAGEIARSLFVPSFWPPITDVLAGADRSVWLRWESPERITHFTRLTADGRAALEVDAPAGVQLLWADASVVWGQMLDDDDVPTLVRFRLVPSP